MSSRPRIGFLPAFFAALAIVFVVAVWLRVRSYDASDAIVPMGPVTATNTTETKQQARSVAHEAPVIEEQPSAPLLPVDLTSPEAVAERALAESRERRYREALTAAHTASTPDRGSAPLVEGKKSGSSVSRVAPTASSVSRRPAPAAAPAPQPQQPPQPSPETPRETSPAAEKKLDDESSDTTPPTVVAIEFTPPAIRDGEETVLSIVAADDLSGVRNISGSITGPSGALQGFALQWNEATNRYLARVVVPKDAAEGIWRINYLSLTDNASNSVHLTGAQSLPASASFRVTSSRSDSTGPTLKSVQVDRPAIRAGEKALILIQAEDDKSGLNLVSGVFQSPSKLARIGFGCRVGSNAMWECELSTPTCLDCGSWQLEQLQLQDKANNVSTIRLDNPLVAGVRIDISGDQCDSQAPVATAVVIDQTTISNVEDTLITVSVTVSDDLCGVNSVSGHFVPMEAPGSNARAFFACTPSGDPNTWVGRAKVPRLAAKGIWRLSWLQILDKGQNLKAYSANDPVAAPVAFRVQ